MTKDRRFPIVAISISAFPIVLLLSAFAFLNCAQSGLNNQQQYLRYHEFWGGNPSEVYSHWLDMVLMSGNAFGFAWLLSAEVFFRQTFGHLKWPPQLMRISAIFGVAFAGGIAAVLDGLHGEGTALFAHVIFFVPILISSYYLLRQLAARVRWRPLTVVSFAASYVVLQVVAQLFYEPSGTGGPNTRIVPIWLGSVGIALMWALIQGIFTGRLNRSFLRFTKVACKLSVLGSVTLIVFAIGVPVTLHAHRFHKASEESALKWLDELEFKLTDAFIADLKLDHTSAKVGKDSGISISSAAHTLIGSPRIKGDNSLRLYFPLSRADYLFLWRNDRFEYCDIRKLTRGETEQIDQDFIDALIANGGTHQTGLYSILWSQYMAGRVIKGADGKVKAICVINLPSP